MKFALFRIINLKLDHGPADDCSFPFLLRNNGKMATWSVQEISWVGEGALSEWNSNFEFSNSNNTKIRNKGRADGNLRKERKEIRGQEPGRNDNNLHR